MVYIGRVVGATCNCYTNSTLSCVNYGYTNAQEMTGLTANVTAVGECEGAWMGRAYVTCANLRRALPMDVGQWSTHNVTTHTHTHMCKHGCTLCMC